MIDQHKKNLIRMHLNSDACHVQIDEMEIPSFSYGMRLMHEEIQRDEIARSRQRPGSSTTDDK